MSPELGREFQKVDPHLRTHHYFKRFVRKTGFNPNLANGILAGLWAFAYDQAKDGDLSRFTPDDLADALDWDTDPEQTVTALIASGFLSKDMVIHDWYDWGGRRYSEREYEARKKADYRYRRKQEEMSPGQSGTSRDCPPLSDQEEEENKKRKSLTPSAAKIAAVSAEEWQERADAVLSATHYPDLYRDLADVLARGNASGKVALSRVVRELYEPLLAVESNGVGRDGFEYGMRAALAKGAANVNYVKKAAANAPANYVPQTQESYHERLDRIASEMDWEET